MASKKGLAHCLFDIGAVKFGSFTLKSGLQSPFYIDLRLLVSHPVALKQMALALKEKADALSFDLIAGIPYAAMAIATAVSLQSNWPMIYPRKETKQYGTKKSVEGVFKKGDTVLVIDDLITTGASKLEALETLQSAGLQVRDFLVLVDRDAGGRAFLEQKGLRLHAVLSIHELFGFLRDANKISKGCFDEAKLFLQKPLEPSVNGATP